MANNPKHKENLKPFKKGNDKRRNVTGENRKMPQLEKLIEEVLGEINEEGNQEIKEILIELMRQAKKGNVKAAEVLLERAYGKVKQVNELQFETPIFRSLDISVKNDNSTE